MLQRQTDSLVGTFIMLLLLLATTGIHTATAQTSSEEETDLPSYDFGGFLQQQFIADGTPDSPARFSIHRARLGVTGKITDRITVNLIGGYTEPPNNTPRLVNAFIDFDLHPLLKLRTGQFLVPFGLEGPQPIPLNPAIERATTTRRLNTVTMFRDIGLQVSGSHSNVNYAIALVNGSGANNFEQVEPKEVVGRVGVNLMENLQVGLSGHVGQYQPNPATDDHESRYRAGADVSYEANPVFIRGEYILRQDDLPGGGSLDMNGGYLLGGYELTGDLEAFARYEYYKPNTNMDDNHFSAVTIGANYYFIGNTRLSANYEFRNDELNPDLGNLFTVQMQVTL